MLELSVKSFRDFLKEKIEKTETCSRFSESEKCTRLQVLEDIADLEIMDEVYDLHDTGWLLQEAVYERSVIEDELNANKSKYAEAYEEYQSACGRLKSLRETVKKYEKGTCDGGDEIDEVDVRETLRDLYSDLEDEKARESGFYKVWNEELAKKRVSDALHKLMGILHEPERYFWYLREA